MNKGEKMKTAGNEPMEMNQVNENTGQDNVFDDGKCHNAILKILLADSMKQIVQETNTSYNQALNL